MTRMSQVSHPRSFSCYLLYFYSSLFHAHSFAYLIGALFVRWNKTKFSVRFVHIQRLIIFFPSYFRSLFGLLLNFFSTHRFDFCMACLLISQSVLQICNAIQPTIGKHITAKVTHEYNEKFIENTLTTTEILGISWHFIAEIGLFFSSLYRLFVDLSKFQ